MNVPIHSAGLPPRSVPRRLLVALVMSFFAHYLIVSNWTGGFRVRHPEIMPAPLRAQLAPPQLPIAAEPETAAARPAEEEALPVKSASILRHAPSVTTGPVVAGMKPQTSAAAEESAPRFYLARELDQYPVPLSALKLDEITPVGAVDNVRLWVNINQFGTVIDAELIDAGSSGASGKSVREMVLATRFVPGRRDGRLVNSRVLLVLGRSD